MSDDKAKEEGNVLPEMFSKRVRLKSGTILDCLHEGGIESEPDKKEDESPTSASGTDSKPIAMLSIHDWMSIAFSSGEDVALARNDWEEEQHPRRGQGQGGGQFAKKGTSDETSEDDTEAEDETEDEGNNAETQSPELTRVNKRLSRYAEHFRNKGQNDAADWIETLQEHINEIGTEAALASLGEARDQEDSKRATYEGAYDELGGAGEYDADFIKGYLNRSGIDLLQQQGGVGDPDSPLISSSSQKNKILQESKTTSRQQSGDYTPSDPTFINKLEESQHLPGLESSEDINKIVGSKVTHITPEVAAKLDEKYGKNSWIIKSYGSEAYAGFGILFPERVKQIQQSAKDVIWGAQRKLPSLGFNIARDQDGTIVGVRKKDKVYKFNTKEYDDAVQGKARELSNQIATASLQEQGARLPSTSETELKNYYGLSLARKANGEIAGVYDMSGKLHETGTPTYQQISQKEGAYYWIKRAIDAAGSKEEEPKFMVQPAFKAVGVSEEDRAAGLTWETAPEGRVHAVVKNGKASIVPYATWQGRGDDLPVVFPTEDSKAMEKAVLDAINQLPESERTNQQYAPDVLKTADGYKVIELNPNTEGGGSAWLGSDPFTIDAYVSHLIGREPAHVKFIRRLLTNKKAKPQSTAFAFKEEEHLRKKRGQEGGGQFVSTDVSGSVKTVKYGSLKVRYSHHERSRIEDPSAAVLADLPHYKQHDQHSCGFVAALTAIHYFNKSIPTLEVLKVVRPTKSGGINRRLLVKAFKQLGIQADYKEDLTIPKLRKYIEDGKPVLVTIWPEDWSSDHWTTIRGISDTRVYLANYKSLTHDDFHKEWFDKGEGLVCTKSSDGSSTGSKSEKPAFSTDSHGHEHSSQDGRFTSKPSSQADADRQATRERKKLTHLKNQQQQARKRETVETLTAILKSAEETANKADEIADNFILDEQTSKKVKKPLRYAKAKARQQYNKLVEKYGVKGALAIWTAGQVIAWGAQIGLPLVGIPIIVPPGGGIATTAALGAMIDKYKKIRGKKDSNSAALSNPKGINQYTKHGPTVASHLFDINDSLDGPPIKEELLEAIRKGGWSDRDEMDVRMLIHAIDHHTLRGNNSVIPMEIHKTLSSVHARNSTHPHRRAIMKVAEHLGNAAEKLL